MPDHYKTLEVDKRASDEVIKSAYQALVKKYRNDEDRLKKLNVAKDVLFDDVKKEEYDNKKNPGKIIGNYRIISKISEGGFGTTYKAIHTDTNCFVCIKHANNISASDEQLLIDEARAVWDLRHWGIPSMRDIIRMDDGSVALVMSYVPGPTLSQILEYKPNNHGLDSEHVAWIVDRCLNTLMYLHMNGVVHGDVKPQNIIIQPNDHTAVLVDYGLSKVKPKRKDKVAGYTPYFAAPEQIEGKPPIPQTDLYGLGMTMIYALGGDIEFFKVPGDTHSDIVFFIKNLIKRDPMSRPKVWREHNLCTDISSIRSRVFGRKSSGMKKLDFPKDFS